jgi:TPR repeat protein
METLMRKLLLASILLLSSHSVLACYDENLRATANFDNCLVEAEQGYAKAQYSLGVMYIRGQGVTQDYKEAFKWVTKAAEEGHEGAQ